MKKRGHYYEGITQALQGEWKRYVTFAVSRTPAKCCGYPTDNAKYRRLLKLAEYQNQAVQGRRKYLPPKENVV